MIIYHTTPFTYLVGWSKLDLWYYGVKYARGCHPTDLWTTYFTSSKLVSALREEHGEPDVVAVRRSNFKNSEQTCACETRVLKAIKRSGKWNLWLNKAINGRVVDPHNEEVRRKMSASHLGVKKGPMSESSKHNMCMRKLGVKRKPFSEETKQKMRESQRRRRSKIVNFVEHHVKLIADKVI